MKNKTLIFWFSLALLQLSVALHQRILEGFLLPLMLLYAIGWSFSWFIRDKKIKAINFFINAGTLVILLGIIYSLLNSFFLFQEVILIFITGIFALEAILSFNAFSLRSLNYIQILTFPIFISFPVFSR